MSAKNLPKVTQLQQNQLRNQLYPLELEREYFMLVLSRKKDEQIVFKVPGREDIRLTVVRIDNPNKVRLGVEADQDVIILRSELDRDNEI
jgi:carbon storage regulator CsrA